MRLLFSRQIQLFPLRAFMYLKGEQSLVIIPTYNEKENLPLIVPAILEILPMANILIVDDNSPDGTGIIAEDFKNIDPRVFTLHRKEKRGLGRAYLAGFTWALEQNYEFIFEMDGDFSHQPKYLPQFLTAISDADLVLGCRYMLGGGIEGWGLHRLLLSRGGNFYAKKVLNLPFRDLTGGFKCFRRRTLETIDFNKIQSDGYNFQIELSFYAHKAGFRIKEVPIVFPDRTEGQSKMNVSIFHEALFGVWRLRKERRT